MKTASAEIRKLVVEAYLSKTASRKKLAEIFSYHIQSIGNWIREFKRDGRVEARPKGHRPSVFTPEEKEQLTEMLHKNVDITLAEIKDAFGKTCHLSTIHSNIVKLGFVFKKNTEGKRTRA